MTEYVAGQAPVEVHPYDQRVWADLGINPWEGENLALADGADRHAMPVMPLVKDYVVQQKKLASANVAADPVLASLKTTWADLEQASKPIRERRAQEREAEQWEPTPANVKRARDTRAQTEIREAIKAPLDAKLQALAALEQTVRDALDNPAPPSAEDMEAALDLQVSLGLLTPQFAIPILLRQLVIEPAQTGKQGKVTALLPIVESLMQRDAAVRDQRGLAEYGYASYAMLDLLTQAKAVSRTASYYANHQKLQAIHVARFKLGEMARGYAQGVGKVGGTPQWYADLGVPYTPPEPAAPYLGELR
jgi:hypothetical protein